MRHKWLLGAVLTFFLATPSLAGNQEASPLFRGDAARTGYATGGPEPPLELRWKFKTGSGVAQIESFPAVDDGLSSASTWGDVIYVGGHDGRVYALTAKTGKEKWHFATQGAINSAPAFRDGTLFVGSRDGFLYALRAADGTLVWKNQFGSRLFRGISYRGVRSSPAVGEEKVYVGACDGRVRALDKTKGRPAWVFDTETEGCYSSPALVGETVYVGSDGLSKSHLFALDARSGIVRWKFSTSTQIFSTPAVAGGVVYFHARNDHVYAVRAEDGGLLWKAPAPNPQDEFSVFADMAKSSPAVARGLVFVGVAKELIALDQRTGAVRWRATTGGRVDSSPLVVGKTVYVGSDDRNVYGFEAESGEKTWTFATGGKVSISPSMGEGLLLVGSNDGYLYAFGPKK